MFSNPRPLAALSQIIAERPLAFWQIFLTVVRAAACLFACFFSYLLTTDDRGVWAHGWGLEFSSRVIGIGGPDFDAHMHVNSNLSSPENAKQGAIELTIGKQDSTNKAPGDIGFGSAFIPDNVRVSKTASCVCVSLLTSLTSPPFTPMAGRRLRRPPGWSQQI